MNQNLRRALTAWENTVRAKIALMARFNAADIWQGCTPRAYDVLYNLSKAPHGKTRQADLTSQLVIPQPSLSRLLERLVRDGLVLREPDPTDRRGTLLRLTERGAQLQREIGRRHAREITRVFADCLTPQEAEQLGIITGKLLAYAARPDNREKR